MFRRRHREPFQELNTTSTADISFMLLIFFLVTSSMDTDKGLLRQLPPLPDEKEQPLDINKEHVMTIALDNQNQLSLDGTLVSLQQLPELLIQRIEGDLVMMGDANTCILEVLRGMYDEIRKKIDDPF